MWLACAVECGRDATDTGHWVTLTSKLNVNPEPFCAAGHAQDGDGAGGGGAQGVPVTLEPKLEL
jgi:hypothetical protein